MELEALRTEIDRIDDQLMALFCQRMDIAAKVADCKKANGLPIHIPAREQEKLAQVAAKTGDLSQYAQALFTTLFSLSREYQAEQIGIEADL